MSGCHLSKLAKCKWERQCNNNIIFHFVQSLVICQSFYNIIRKYLGDVGLIVHFLTDRISEGFSNAVVSSEFTVISKGSIDLRTMEGEILNFRLSIYQAFRGVVISQLFWLIYLFGTPRWLTRGHTGRVRSFWNMLRHIIYFWRFRVRLQVPSNRAILPGHVI